MNIKIKTPEDLKIMAEGGRILSSIKKKATQMVKEGVSAWEIEEEVTNLIEKSGAKPSFKMVPGYSWSTCINVNDGVVHGIPKKEIIFKDNDIVSIDLGIFYKGFHTDTSVTVQIGKEKHLKLFLDAGRSALNKAIKEVRVGKTISDISMAIEKNIESKGFTPVKALTGHGVGRELHEDPPIPCFTKGLDLKKITIKEGFVLAIEVMYTKGSEDLIVDEDGWTIRTKDGKIAALFEETVAATCNGPLVLTDA
jgi:methionyl aminopeptidase